MSQTKSNKHGHKRQAVNIGFLVGGLVWLVISGTSSFGFFYTYLPSIVPAGIAGSIAPVISGVIGVALFDVAGILWLAVYLHHTETAAQRAIAMIMAVVTFAGSVASTVAYFALEATSGGNQLILLESSTANVIGWFALAVVILGSALNFIGYNLYNSQSLENQRRIREDNQRDVIQAAEDEQSEYLTDLVTSSVKSKIKALAESLAEEEAAHLVNQYQLTRRARFAGDVQQLPAQRAALAASSSPAPAAAERAKSGEQYDVSDLNAMARQFHEATQQEAPQRPTNGRSAGQ